MSLNHDVSSRRAHKNQRGQSLIFVTFWSVLVFGMAAIVVDIGLVYLEQSELNASTQSAAIAAGWAMSQPGATVASVTNAATTYGGTPGNLNTYGNLTGVKLATGYPVLSCLATVTNVFGIQCWGPSNSNAVVVRQQVTVPLFFLRLFGSSLANLSATATASMRGGAPGPLNVAIIVDSTHSMNDTDSDSNCSSTRISCALSGVRVLLNNLSPCFASEASCGAATNGNVANPVDRVSLLTFPAVTTTTAADDYNCGSTTPTIQSYATPFPATSTYQIVNFSSDYRTSNTATSLNPNSNLVAAVGGKTGCTGLQAIGGYGTYYAQVIKAAQAYLVAEQTLYPSSQNVLVMISDGDANASSSDMPGASTTSGVYMSTLQECHQAITAAQAATAAGTRIYAIAYGAEATGCATDTSPTITPCQTMQQIASSGSYFYSDYTATGGSSTCVSASQPVTGLTQIFSAVAADLGLVKLLPNGTT
jgi:hypothetical protein